VRGSALIFAWVCLLFSSPAFTNDFTLNDEEIKNENDFLAKVGLSAEGRQALLKQPFQKPYSHLSFLVPTEWHARSTSKTVLADDLLLDLPVLREVMEKVYIGWEIQAARGWDWDAWFKSWETWLRERRGQSIDTYEAFQFWDRYSDFHLDNHSGPRFVNIDRRYGSSSRSYVLEQTPNGLCTLIYTQEGGSVPLPVDDKATQPFQARLGSTSRNFESASFAYYLSFPKRSGTAKAVVCGEKEISLKPTWKHSLVDVFPHIKEIAKIEEDRPMYRRIDSDIGYVRMPKMMGANLAPYDQLAKDLVNLSDKTEQIVIADNRGNGGGNHLSGLKVLSHWFELSYEKDEALYHLYRRKHSCFDRSMDWLLYQQAYLSRGPVFLTETIKKAFDALFQPFPKDCNVSYEDFKNPFVYQNRGFDPSHSTKEPLLLFLTDDGCGSSCETITYQVAQKKNALIAGVSSYGVDEYGFPATLILPRTKVGFRIARELDDSYGDGRSFDGRGYEVDYLLDAEETQTAEYLAEFARSLVKMRKKHLSGRSAFFGKK
jgi:hypothetical protein